MQRIMQNNTIFRMSIVFLLILLLLPVRVDWIRRGNFTRVESLL